MFWTAILICQRLHIYIWQVTLFVMWCEGLLNICRSFCTFLKCADEDVNQQSIKRTVGRRVCRHSLHKTSSPCLSLCSLIVDLFFILSVSTKMRLMRTIYKKKRIINRGAEMISSPSHTDSPLLVPRYVNSLSYKREDKRHKRNEMKSFQRFCLLRVLNVRPSKCWLQETKGKDGDKEWNKAGRTKESLKRKWMKIKNVKNQGIN